LAARVLAGLQAALVAKRALGRVVIIGQVGIGFVAAVANRVTPAALKTFQFPRVNRQLILFRLVMVVLTDERAFSPIRILFALAVRWN
jgi:hypothetical protein